MGNKALATILSGLALFCLQATTSANNRYPIAFSDTADWRGLVTSPPPDAAAVMRARVMSHSVVLVTLTSIDPIDDHKAARLAYTNVFSNVGRLPAGPLYVVVVVYGPASLMGAYPEYAFVFERDSTKNGWRPRPVPGKKELSAIECAIGQCPNL
jgi:hypothetical protein